MSPHAWHSGHPACQYERCTDAGGAIRFSTGGCGLMGWVHALPGRVTTALLAALLATVLLVGVETERSSAAVVPLYPNLHTLAPRSLTLDRADVTPDLTGDFHNVLRF